MKAAKEKTALQSSEGKVESELKPEMENSNSSCSSQVEKERPKLEFAKSFGSNNSKTEYVPEIQTEEERIEFQKKMQEKLQAHLAAEGKLYPRPKPSPAINPVTGFANDGSFLELFKKMQEQAQSSDDSATQYYTATSSMAQQQLPQQQYMQPQLQQPVPFVGRRRGGKILKTGIVKKARPIDESYADSPNDAWNLYLQEVKKYKNASCDADSKTRPLVK